MKNYKNMINIAQIYEELDRRNYDALAGYNSGKIIHQKQLNFHKSQKQNRWVFGGNRTSKTECGWNNLARRGNHPYRRTKPNVVGWVVSLST